MSKIGILGGSFDPVTIGHTAIIKEAIKQLQLDLFLVIPTLHNPWKDNEGAASFHRVEMLKIALRSMDKAKVDLIEIKTNAKKNYTIDTIKKLKKRYPNDTLYYIMGMDQASKFHLWKEANQINELVQLCVFDRSGYQKNETMDSFHFQILHIKPLQISSSDARNGAIQYLDPEVLKYIMNHGLYLDTLIQPMMSKKRYLHSVSVANTAKEIALKNDVDPLKAYIAGMMHDIAKEMDFDEAKKIMEQQFPQYIEKPVPIWHQWLSQYVCIHKYLLTDKEILQAIRHHTTGSTNMSKLDMCIYIADKYDPLRGFDSSKELALAKKDVEEGFRESLKGFYKFSKEKHRDIDEIFYEIYRKYVEEEIHE